MVSQARARLFLADGPILVIYRCSQDILGPHCWVASYLMSKRLAICLINPRSRPSYWTADYAMPFHGLGRRLRYSMANGAVISVAALVPPEHEVVIIDENVETLNYSRLRRFDIIGITGMVVQSDRMLEILSELSESPAIIAVGGPLVSVHEGLFENLADVMFIGEADETWPEFVACVADGKEFRARYQQTERTDMTRVPTPRFDLLKKGVYGTAPVQFSRGCPFQCEFCDIITIFGRKPRVKSADQVLAELDAVHDQGFRGCFLVDDNFIGNKREAKRLLPRIIEWQERKGYPLVFTTEASVNLSDDPELIEMMARANFQNVFVGIETPRKASLAETKKFQNLHGDSLLEKIQRIRKGGITVSAGFIVGFDSDDAAIFDEQYDFIQQSGIGSLSVSILTPLPTTPLYDRLLAEGRLDLSDPELMFTPKQMSREELKNGFKDLLRRIWTPEAYFSRVFIGIAEHGVQKPYGRSRPRWRSAAVARIFDGVWTIRAAYLAFHMMRSRSLLRHSRVLRDVIRKNRRLGRSRLSFAEFVGHWITYWHFASVTRDISGTDFGSIGKAPSQETGSIASPSVQREFRPIPHAGSNQG